MIKHEYTGIHASPLRTCVSRRSFVQRLSATALLGLSAKATAEPNTLPALRKLAGGRPLIGAAVPTNFQKNLALGQIELLKTHFDSVTPENCMKWQDLCPIEGQYKFEPLDQIVEFAKQHQQKIVGHTLIFNRDGNYPDWIFKDGTKEADENLLWKRIESHVEKVMTRYKDSIDSWDVLNEFVEPNQLGFRETALTRVLGGNYPVRLFKFVGEIDPKAKLIYNDFYVENPQRLKATLNFVRSLREKGCRVDIVGNQSHIELKKKSGEAIDAMIKKFTSEGFRCALTELDVDVISRDGAFNPKNQRAIAERDPYVNGCPDEVLNEQAKEYGEVFQAVMNNHKSVERVTFWGISDRNSWLNDWPWKRTNHGLIFDRESKPKPAFHAIAKVLAKG